MTAVTIPDFKFKTAYDFDGAARLLTTQDLDQMGDPTSDMGEAFILATEPIFQFMLDEAIAAGDVGLTTEQADLLYVQQDDVGVADVEVLFQASVDGDTQQRFKVDHTGRMDWGSGSAVADAYLYRSAAGVLRTSAKLRMPQLAVEIAGGITDFGVEISGGNTTYPLLQITGASSAEVFGMYKNKTRSNFPFHAYINAADAIPITVHGYASQTEDLTKWLDNSDVALARVTPSGGLRSAEGLQLGATTSAFGGGAGGVLGMKNATTVPTTNPSGGGVMYSTGGRLRWRDNDGNKYSMPYAGTSAPTNPAEDDVWIVLP